MPFKDKEKAKEYDRKYRKRRYHNDEEYRKKRNKAVKKWRKKNPKYSREWEKKHRKERNEKQEIFRKSNPEKISEIGKRYYRKNTKKLNEKCSKWRQDNKEKTRAYCRRREAMKRGADGSHTLKEWEELKALHNYTCLICGKKEPEIKLTEDHIIPISKDGSDYIKNIQPLCQKCNSIKRDKL